MAVSSWSTYSVYKFTVTGACNSYQSWRHTDLQQIVSCRYRLNVRLRTTAFSDLLCLLFLLATCFGGIMKLFWEAPWTHTHVHNNYRHTHTPITQSYAYTHSTFTGNSQKAKKTSNISCGATVVRCFNNQHRQGEWSVCVSWSVLFCLSIPMEDG